MQRIELLDTTLRDGAQGEGVEHSLSDKRKIALALDRLGIPLIEGGNPTGNPKDQTFFEEARKAPFLTQAVLVPFGSTCHAGAAPEEDAGLAALLGTEQPVVSLFGKADIRQVTEVLRVTPQENLRMIRESVAYLAGQGRRVLFDAEHFTAKTDIAVHFRKGIMNRFDQLVINSCRNIVLRQMCFHGGGIMSGFCIEQFFF